MPYDPNLPQENTLADAAQMRAQFQASLGLHSAPFFFFLRSSMEDGALSLAG